MNKNNIKKKLKFLILIIFFLSGYYWVNSSIGKNDSFLQTIKLKTPEKLRNILKETIFVFKNQKNLKKKILEISKNKITQIDKIYNKPIINNQLINNFRPKSILKLIDIRNNILNNFILDESQVSFSKTYDLEQTKKEFKSVTNGKIETYKLNYYNINHFGILEKTKINRNKLLIYSQGHMGNPYEFSYFLKIKERFKKEGYDVLSLSMTGIGYNKNQEINFPNYKENLNPSLHKTYSTYFDNNFPNKKPLSLILSGNYYLIKNIIKQGDYQDVVMVGISGGGWYTTLLSSVITQIKSSYSFAGTMPLMFRLYFSYLGDWEQIDSSLFDDIDYDSLYVLSTLNDNKEFTRKHYQIYNDKDTCCFKNPEAMTLKKIYEKLKIKNFEIVVVENDKHSIDTNFLFKNFFNK